MTGPDAFTLRQSLAADYAYARDVGGFVSLSRSRRMHNYTARLVRMTGLSREQVVANARQDAKAFTSR